MPRLCNRGNRVREVELLLVRNLSEGRSRFCELERSLAGISPRTLSLRLRALEEEGIVERHTFPEVPPRVEYALTEKGLALLPIIEDMRPTANSGWAAPAPTAPPRRPSPSPERRAGCKRRCAGRSGARERELSAPCIQSGFRPRWSTSSRAPQAICRRRSPPGRGPIRARAAGRPPRLIRPRSTATGR